MGKTQMEENDTMKDMEVPLKGTIEYKAYKFMNALGAIFVILFCLFLIWQMIKFA